VYGGAGHATESPADELRHTGHRLRTGIAVTFVAVACLAVATSAAWWPSGSSSSGSGEALVEVRTGTGVACGVLRPADAGNLVVDVAGQTFTVALSDVVSVRPVDSC
jgi:hypothetical protein